MFVCLFSRQAVYVTATLPYIVLAIFFGRGITLEGSVDGIIHMFKPEVLNTLEKLHLSVV